MRKKTGHGLTRRGFWKATAAASLVCSEALRGKASAGAEGGIVEDYGGPTPPADEIVLFPFDDFSIPLRYRLQIGLVSASNAYQLNTRRVLEKGKPGTPDAHHLLFDGSVARVGDELRMWYPGWSANDSPPRVCYAVSKDGINWTKPALGLVEFGGNFQNNLVDYPAFKGDSCFVIYDPEDPDHSRLYKMISEVSPFEIRAAFSPDGLHWKDSPHNPILKHNSLEPGGLTKFNGCYFLNGQGSNVGSKRALVTYLSYDFDHWSDAVAVGLRRDVPPYRQAPGAHAGEQVHDGAALWNRSNVVLGAYGQWHGDSNDRRFVTIDLGLLVSNDAIHFREPIPDFKLILADETLVPEDQETAVPASKLDAGQAFENVGDQTLFWYGPWAGGFIWAAAWVRDRLGYFEVVRPPRAAPLATEDTHSLMWAQMLQIDKQPVDPHFISCPLRVSGPRTRLFLNAAGLSEESHLTVELLDQRFNGLPGYSGQDCIRVTKSGLRQTVGWRDTQTLEKFGRPFRIKVRWGGKRPEDAYVYALYVAC